MIWWGDEKEQFQSNKYYTIMEIKYGGVIEEGEENKFRTDTEIRSQLCNKLEKLPNRGNSKCKDIGVKNNLAHFQEQKGGQ